MPSASTFGAVLRAEAEQALRIGQRVEQRADLVGRARRRGRRACRRSEAILATSLFGATPTEAVQLGALADQPLDLARDRARRRRGLVLAVTSRKASSSDRPSTSGVNSRKTAKTCARHLGVARRCAAARRRRAGRAAARVAHRHRRAHAEARAPRSWPPRRRRGPRCRRRSPAGRAARGRRAARPTRRTRPCRRGGWRDRPWGKDTVRVAARPGIRSPPQRETGDNPASVAPRRAICQRTSP